MVGPHVLVAITPHGYGHLAQVVPVLQRLLDRQPRLRVTIQTTLSESLLRGLIPGPFRHQARATDFGIRMDSALDLRLEESARDYARLHRRWGERLAQEVSEMAALAPDLVLADVPYLPLAAAQALDIPNVALCSLNWAEIYRGLLGQRPEAATILAQMDAAYGGADAFLCPAPSMAMPGLANRVSIGPIARQGKDRRDALRRRLGLETGQRLVLVSLGGVPTALPVADWPRGVGIHWLLAGEAAKSHPDVTPIASLGSPFLDLLTSVDAVVGKCGYGMVAECACNATPLLYVPRPQWPEEPCLVEWLKQQGRCAPLDRSALERGEITTVLEHCLSMPAPTAPVPTGAGEAAELLLRYLADA